jgi:hypothetical protein
MRPSTHISSPSARRSSDWPRIVNAATPVVELHGPRGGAAQLPDDLKADRGTAACS